MRTVDVSILVLLDDSLEDIRIDEYSWKPEYVSILVLLDDSLEVHARVSDHRDLLVSILVLLDDSLEGCTSNWHSNDEWFQSLFSWMIRSKTIVCNYIISDGVSILVLLDDRSKGLHALFETGRTGFNPCSLG